MENAESKARTASRAAAEAAKAGVSVYSAGQRLQYASEDGTIPAGAIMMTTEQMHDIVGKKMNDWKPRMQMVPLQYGSQVAGGFAGATGFMYTLYFREAMRLRHHARVASIVPSVFLPTMITTTAHLLLVSNQIKTGQITCPVCLHMRALLIQVSAGFVLPVILGAISSSSVARTIHSYALPPITEVRELTRIYARILRTLRLPNIVLLVCSVVTAYAVTSSEEKAAYRLHSSLTSADAFVS